MEVHSVNSGVDALRKGVLAVEQRALCNPGLDGLVDLLAQDRVRDLLANDIEGGHAKKEWTVASPLSSRERLTRVVSTDELLDNGLDEGNARKSHVVGIASRAGVDLEEARLAIRPVHNVKVAIAFVANLAAEARSAIEKIRTIFTEDHERVADPLGAAILDKQIGRASCRERVFQLV